MNKRILFFAFSLLLSVSIFAQWEKPTCTGAELQYSTLATGEVAGDTIAYYLYNEEAGMFYTRGNNWGARASVSKYPSSAIKTFFVKYIGAEEEAWDGTSFKVYNYHSTRGKWMNLFIDAEEYAYVDHGSQAKTMIFGAEKNGNAYRFYANGRESIDTGGCWDRDTYPTHYLGIDKSMNDSVLYPLLNIAKEGIGGVYLVDFKLIPVTDTEFMDKCNAYVASGSLADAIAEAEASEYASSLTEQINAAKTVYNNHNSTLLEINTAINALKVAMNYASVMGATEDNPKDATGFIQNADFSAGNIDGWTCTFVAGTNATNVGYQSASYSNGDVYINGFIEAWAAEGKSFNPNCNHRAIGDGKLSQIMPNLPQGKYKFTCDAIVNYQDNPTISVNGVEIFATGSRFTAKQAIHTGNGAPEHFELTFINSGGDVELGLRTNNADANWIAADNFTLTYYGESYLTFVDNTIKTLCISQWDTNGDGELSTIEAAAVTDLNKVFQGNKDITSFDELKYFIKLTSIGDYAFSGCTGLTSVTIPNSVTSIGECAFSGCSNLISINIPNSVTSIGERTFFDCTHLPIEDNLRYADTYLVEVVGKDLSTYTIKDGTKWIGDNAFSVCSSMTSITIPNSVTSIGCSAFQFCSSLTSITIPNSVTNIKWGTFYGCSGLTSVTIPNLITSIEAYAFYNCSSLTSVIIPSSVTSIQSYAFHGCSNLMSVIVGWTDAANIVIPSTLSVFYNVDLSKAILHVPASTKALYEAADVWKNFGAIEECVPNNEIWYTAREKLPETISDWGSGLHTNAFNTAISSHSFSDGKGVIKFNSNVTSIGNDAFCGCSGLTSITIPGSVTNIGTNPFIGCTGLETITVSKENTCFSDYGCNVIVNKTTHELISGCNKSTIPGSVTSIGDEAFYECSGLISITIPNSVTSIGNSAFWWCTGLTSITIPNSVTSIGMQTFYCCSGLTSITIPNSVTSIGGYAFEGCSGLTSITIPGSVTNIGTNPFIGCTGLETITVSEENTCFSDYGCNVIVNKTTHELISGCNKSTIPGSVTSIGDEAFYKCSGLISVTIPNSVTSIGMQTFYCCSGLTSVSIPNSVTNIGEYTFQDCSSLTFIIIGDSVTSIGDGVFCNCSGLTSITIPNSVTSIDKSAFYGCSGLTSITIPNSVTSIGEYTFASCTGLTSITIPKSVTSIGNNVFYGCNNLKELVYSYGATKALNLGLKNLTSVTLPKTITTIEASAFIGCSCLQSLDIPKSVTSIGAYAFQNMTSLKEMYVHWDEPLSVAANILNGVSTGSATLYVPSSAVDAYKSAAVWKNFGTITFSGEEPYNFLAVDKNGDEIKKEVEAYDDVVLYDNHKNLTIIEDIGNVNITYSRTFKNANWQPLYVPFDMTVTSDLLQRFSFAKFAGTYTEQDNSGNVSFFITIVRLLEGDKIKANTPYFIQAKTADASNAQTISVDGTTLHKTEEMNFSMYSAEKKLSVYGIYNQKICAYDGEYYAYSAGKYSKQLTGAKLGAFRFYVTIENREDNPYGTSSPAEIKLKVVGDDATGISDANVDADADINGNCFNLAGQVVGPDYKGIVIKNGKKMYNK